MEREEGLSKSIVEFDISTLNLNLNYKKEINAWQLASIEQTKHTLFNQSMLGVAGNIILIHHSTTAAIKILSFASFMVVGIGNKRGALFMNNPRIWHLQKTFFLGFLFYYLSLKDTEKLRIRQDIWIFLWNCQVGEYIG
jgi:hypothetical protein